MSYGLQVWDASGALVLDVSDRISRFVGTYSYSIPNGSTETTVSVPGAESSTWFAYTHAHTENAEVVTNGVRVARPSSAGSTSGTLYVFRM